MRSRRFTETTTNKRSSSPKVLTTLRCGGKLPAVQDSANWLASSLQNSPRATSTTFSNAKHRLRAARLLNATALKSG